MNMNLDEKVVDAIFKGLLEDNSERYRNSLKKTLMVMLMLMLMLMCMQKLGKHFLG